MILPPYDLNKPLVYFHIGELNSKVPVRRVQEDTLWVDYNRDLFLQREFECFIVLENGRGIYSFIGEVLSFGPVEEAKVDIVGIRVMPGTSKIVNRREYVRLDQNIQGNIEVKLGHQIVPCKLIDLSANGVRLEMGKEFVDYNAYYHLRFQSDFINKIEFETAFKIIHTFKEDSLNQSTYGAVFLKDIISSKIVAITEAKQREIKRWIDYVMIDRKKKAHLHTISPA
ncbi:PilZ domain-containing protein [bacterium]|nr:PilZ domain-containing protein [bacterium]